MSEAQSKPDTDTMIQLRRDAGYWRTYGQPVVKWLATKGVTMTLVSAAGAGTVLAIRDGTTNAPDNMQSSADGVARVEKRIDALDNPQTGTIPALQADVKKIKEALLGTEYAPTSGLVYQFAQLKEQLAKSK